MEKRHKKTFLFFYQDDNVSNLFLFYFCPFMFALISELFNSAHFRSIPNNSARRNFDWKPYFEIWFTKYKIQGRKKETMNVFYSEGVDQTILTLQHCNK